MKKMQSHRLDRFARSLRANRLKLFAFLSVFTMGTDGCPHSGGGTTATLKPIASIEGADIDYVAVFDKCTYSAVEMWDRYLVRKGLKITAETTSSLQSKYPKTKPWDVADWLSKVNAKVDFVMGDGSRLTSLMYDNLKADKNDKRLKHPTTANLVVKQPSVVATRGSNPTLWNQKAIEHMVLVTGVQIDSAGTPVYAEGLNPDPSKPRILRGKSGALVNYRLDGLDWLDWIQLGSTTYVPANPAAAPIPLASGVGPTTAMAGLWMPPSGLAKPTAKAFAGVLVGNLEAAEDLCGGT